jgi:hypothetical protein
MKPMCSMYIIYKHARILFGIREIIYATVRKIVNEGIGVAKQEKFRREILELYEGIQSTGSISLISLVEVMNCCFSTLYLCNWKVC